MAINGIPEVLNDYNAYLSGNRMVGTTGEVKLPDLEGLTETIKGCGIPGNVDQMGMRVVFRGRAKKLSPGDMKQGKAMNGSVTLGLTYIYIELDGSPKFELDKLNSVFKVNGVDLLAKVRKYT